MGKRIADFLRSDLGVLLLIAGARVLFHVFTNGQYGFHRDELQTLDDARHLEGGFVAYPPIAPLIGRLELTLFGTSLIGFRVFAAVAVSGVMVLAGLIGKELGGTRQTQVLAAVAAGISPVSLTQGAVFQYVSLDYLWGVATTYFLVRLAKSDDPRWWPAVGATLGLGMETRYTAGFLALGMVGAVLLTPIRRHLLSGWLWAGVAFSILIFLPNLVWQGRHHFISLDFLSHLHARDLRQGRYKDFYIGQLLVCLNFVTVPLAFLGLGFYFRRPVPALPLENPDLTNEGLRLRLLGWTFLLTFLLFAIAGSRSYYTAPLYPMLVAGGSVMFGIWARRRQPRSARLANGLQWSALLAAGVCFSLLLLPVAPIGSRVWRVTAKLHDQFREEIGWPELAQSVAAVYNALPPEERARTGILAGNYGEGGALNLYGPALGLPHTMSLTNSFWYRGYDPRLPQTVILTGFDREEAEKVFASCVLAGNNGNPWGVDNEESREHPDILVCRNLKPSWPQYWATHRRFG
ncbi:MAG TPA: glycosyltransferase family 39 protein [Candidatus Eisenbacteria bacterium]|nr:glycosyltransferase family 39 protein [Candidatus Eisenbacteria bacterium]